MRRPALTIALRLRLPSTVSASVGLIAVMAAVGALFPTVGHTIGTLKIPKGVSNLLGGADYGTITGWFRSEIGSVYGPLVIGGLAIAGAVATTAGEEEDRILALTLAYPIPRAALIASRAAAIAGVVLAITAATWVGLVIGVALGGGGISLTHITAFAIALALFGFATGSLAVALGAGTGRRALAAGVASGVAIAGWLVYGFAPLVGGLQWLKYLTFFYYYAGQDPLTHGFDLGGAIVLAACAFVLTVVGIVGIRRRDLRG